MPSKIARNAAYAPTFCQNEMQRFIYLHKSHALEHFEGCCIRIPNFGQKFASPESMPCIRHHQPASHRVRLSTHENSYFIMYVCAFLFVCVRVRARVHASVYALARTDEFPADFLTSLLTAPTTHHLCLFSFRARHVGSRPCACACTCISDFLSWWDDVTLQPQMQTLVASSPSWQSLR